jgi:probable HAF family extracellular repeat protein
MTHRYFDPQVQVSRATIVLPRLITKKLGIPLLVIAFVFIGAMSSHTGWAQGNTYDVLQLSGASVPFGLNNWGDVAGKEADSATGETRAATWQHGGLRRRSLGKLAGGDYSSASAINDSGQVVGAGNTSDSCVPFLWMSGNGFRRVPLLRGDNCGQAVAINRYGHVIGYSSGPNGKKAFLWRGGNNIQSLSALPGGSYSRASGVNDSDTVVGVSDSMDGDRAVLWTSSGNLIDLGTLPGDLSSEATAINNNGTVVGFSKGPQGMRAFVWTQASGMQEIGLLPGATSSRALAINDADAVVGSSTTSSGDRAFMWTRQEGIQDLNDEVSPSVGVMLVEAHAINKRGQILALGMNMHGMDDVSPSAVCAPAPPASFLLTPR